MLTFKEALEQIDDETKAIIEEALLEVAEEMDIGVEDEQQECDICMYAYLDEETGLLRCSIHQKSVNDNDWCECYE